MSPSVAILSALHAAAGQFVRLDGPAVAGELAELRSLGFVIEAHPHLGYRLVETPDRLVADDLRSRIDTRVIGSTLTVFDETASTNDVVARLADGGHREGAVVFAERQTKGRGRHGRAWVSPRGKGLWFSVLLRPAFPLPRVTVAASVAVARVAGPSARIKWPNDVTIGGRKLAGILTEVRDGAAILGIGVNVNCGEEDLPAELQATSLVTEDRPGLAARLLMELDTLYRQAANDFATISAEWARRGTTLGKQIVVRMGGRRIEGFAQALDEDGALLIRRDSGQIERVLGADLTVERA